MIKKLALGLLLLISPLFINALEVKDKVLQYQENMAMFKGIVSTDDGGYILAGAVAESETNASSFIVKFSKENQIEWQKIYSDQSGVIFEHIEETSDGYVMIGSKNNINTLNCIVLKISKSGDILWEKEYKETGVYGANVIRFQFKANDIEVLNDDSIVITGTENGIGILIKYSSDGTLIYERRYAENISFSGLTATNDGGHAVVGYAYFDSLTEIFGDEISSEIIENNDTNPNYGYARMYNTPLLIKYDKDSKIEWIQTLVNGTNEPNYVKGDGNYGSMSNSERTGISDIIQTSSGEYIIVGSVSENDINIENNLNQNDNYGTLDMQLPQPFIAKYTPDGTLSWIKLNKNIVSGTYLDIEESGNGSFWIVGRNSSEEKMMIVKYSSTGEILSSKEFSAQIDPEYSNYTTDYKLEDVEILNNEKIITIAYLSVMKVDLNTTEDGNVSIEGANQPHFIYIIGEEYNLTLPNEMSKKVEVMNDGNIYSIKVSPDKGYEVDKIIIKDKDGKILDIKVTQNQDGTYSFKVYEDVNLEVLFKEELTNPKTGVIDLITILFFGFAMSFCGFFITKKYAEGYQI